jgi:hypothetical protein
MTIRRVAATASLPGDRHRWRLRSRPAENRLLRRELGAKCLRLTDADRRELATKAEPGSRLRRQGTCGTWVDVIQEAAWFPTLAANASPVLVGLRHLVRQQNRGKEREREGQADPSGRAEAERTRREELGGRLQREQRRHQQLPDLPERRR